jgi:hypothetical protein
MDNIRIPECGLQWISDGLTGLGLANGARFGPMEVPAGVLFDAVELTSVFGRAVLDRLIDDRRQVGPVIMDGIRHRVLFLVAPGVEAQLELLRIEYRIPAGIPIGVSGLGQLVRLPAPVTRQDAQRRWLIAPRSRLPQLTTIEDLLEAVTGCVRQRIGEARRGAEPIEEMGVLPASMRLAALSAHSRVVI